MARRRRGGSSQVILGLLIVLLGMLMLGQTTDLYDVGFLLDFVPSLFVLLGVYTLIRSGFRNVFGPLVVIAVAGAWQVVALGYVSADQVVRFWPVFVVLFGLSLVLSYVRRRPDAAPDTFVSAIAIFGGSEKRSTSAGFTGANLTALFGGAELDLREAEVADPPAHVNAVALFGGVSVVVPRDWNVELDVLPVLGGAADDRPRRDRTHDETDLVVSGFTAFGGVSVED